MVPLLAAPLSPRSVASSWQASSASSDPDSPYETPADLKDRLAWTRPELRRATTPRWTGSARHRWEFRPRLDVVSCLCGVCILALLAVLARVGPPQRRQAAQGLPSRQQWSVAYGAQHRRANEDPYSSTQQLGSFASAQLSEGIAEAGSAEDLNPIADYLQAQASGLIDRPAGLYHGLPVHQLWNISFAVSSAQWQLGSQAAACQSIAPASAGTLAIVGNGPLTPEQRTHIDSMDRVVRFNAMNSRLKGERVDMWVVRFNNEAPLHYWGLKQLGEIESEAMLQQAGSVLFVDGPRPSPPASVRDVAAWYPGAPQHRLLQLDIAQYWKLYDAVLTKEPRYDDDLLDAKTMPSTGLLGLLAALSCVRQQAVHLFGFNWSRKSYYMHQMGAEELIVQQLRAAVPMTIHEPACAALYSCHPQCDSSDYRAAVDGLDAGCAASKKARMRQKEVTVERKRRAREAAQQEAPSRQQAGSSKASKAGEGAAQPAKYGFTPRLSRLRSEVLSLLAEGHRIDQPQARQVTEMLHASLQAQGLAPNITVRTSSQMYEGASATD